MKAKQMYGLIGIMALFAVCASAFAQDGSPPPNDQNGPPPMQRPGGGMMGRRMGPSGMEPLIMRPDVQKELKVTDDQMEKIKQLLPPPPMGGLDGGRMRGPGNNGGPEHGGQRGGQGGPPEGGMRRIGPDAMDEHLAQVLSDSQMKRLKELRLQRQGGMALGRREIADKVGLTDDERQRIRGMIDEAMEPQRDMQDGPPDRKTMEAKRAKLSAEILKSLSSSEKAKWDEICGKPFKFDENWHPKPPEGGRGAPDRGDGPPPPPAEGGGE